MICSFIYWLCCFLPSPLSYLHWRRRNRQKYINFTALVAGNGWEYVYCFHQPTNRFPFFYSFRWFLYSFFRTPEARFSFYFVALSINIRHRVVCVRNFYLNKRCGEWSEVEFGTRNAERGRNEKKKREKYNLIKILPRTEKFLARTNFTRKVRTNIPIVVECDRVHNSFFFPVPLPPLCTFPSKIMP